MANLNRPFGLRPIRSGNGSPWCGEVQLYHIPSTDGTEYHIGDPVTLAGTGDATGVPSVSIGVPSAPILGSITSVHPVKPIRPSLIGLANDLETTNIPAAKSRDYYVMVVNDPDIIYLIQEDSVGGALAVTDIGANIDFAVVAPSEDFQYSGTVIDSSTVGAGVGLSLKLLGQEQRDADNEVGDFADWLVRINNHQFRTGTAGV